MTNIDHVKAEKHVNDWLEYATKGKDGASIPFNQTEAALAIQADPMMKQEVISHYLNLCNSGAQIEYDTVSEVAQRIFDQYKNIPSFDTAFAGSESGAIVVQSAHMTGLLQTQRALKQELAEHDAALLPVVEAMEKLEKDIEESKDDLRRKESSLSSARWEASAAQREAAETNSQIRSQINDLEGKLQKYNAFKNKSANTLDNLHNPRNVGDFLDGVFGSFFNSIDDATTYSAGTVAEWSRRLDECKRQLVSTSASERNVRYIESDVRDAENAIQLYEEEHERHVAKRTELENKKTYEILTQLTVTEHAIHASRNLMGYAADSGTSLDATLEKVGSLAIPFVDGRLTREALDAAVEWSKTQRGNLDLPPEQLAFKQFINRRVIPNIGAFEAYASMIDDLNQTGIETHQPLELLKQKTISFSGRKPSTELALPSEKKLAKGEALELAESLPAVKIDAIIRSSNPIAVSVADAVGENEKHLQGFEGLFAGVEKKIDDLLAKANEKEARRQELTELVRAGRTKNERIDEQLGRAQSELDAKIKHLPEDKPKGARILSSVLSSITKRTGEGVILGGTGGTMVVPGLGTLSGALGGGVAGAALGGIEGVVDFFAVGKKGLSREGELAIHQEIIDYLRSQRVDTEKYSREIEGISHELTELVKSGEYQAEVGSHLKAERVMKAYVARSLLRSGWQNTNLLAESCEQNGIESLDAFVNAFKGEMGVSLKRFCFGLANSNDMSLILAEADSLSGDQLKPHERALKDFVENIMKPDIGGYLSKASKVDVISQSNILPYGAHLECTKGILRDENDPKLSALVANEFGMSVVGVQDVKHVFDFYLHRHGDRQLYDAKLKDGQMTDQYPAKRINVYPPEEVERFVDMTKQSMSHGRKTQPQVSDMFLRVCAYEYFMPQAVRTAGADNIFSENPEAPAAYPMVNATVNKFIEAMSLGPIQKYRELVGERLDNVIAQTFIDYFATLGAMHLDDPKIKPLRKNLRDAGNTEDYGPVFSVYTRKISNDSSGRFELFLDIYRHNLEKHFQVFTEEDRKLLEEHLAALPDPSKTILTPRDIVKPGSHRARLLAAYEDHTLENLSKKTNTDGHDR